MGMRRISIKSKRKTLKTFLFSGISPPGICFLPNIVAEISVRVNRLRRINDDKRIWDKKTVKKQGKMYVFLQK
jgi:hypothetical protein